MKGDRLRIVVGGAGHMGLATPVGQAELGRDGVRIEDPYRLAALAEGWTPLYELGLQGACATQHVQVG